MCSVTPTQACNSNDYEGWRALQPQDGSPAPCLLGREINMQRRKRDAACFNGQDWLTEGHVQTCPCGQVSRPWAHRVCVCVAWPCILSRG